MAHAQPENILSPGIKSVSFPREYIMDYNINIIDLIKYFINNNHYAFMYVSREHISLHKWSNFTHEMFIYGYDDNNSKLFISDFFDGNAYSEEQCGYDEFTNAFAHASKGLYIRDGCFDDLLSSEKVNFIAYDTSFTYTFSTEKFAEDILFYLNKEKYELNYTPHILHAERKCEIVWGNKYYEVLDKYYYMQINFGSVDLRKACFVRDHKKSLAYKINYLLDKDLLSDIALMETAKELVALSEQLVNILIKFNISGNRNIYKKVTALLSNIKHKEEELLLALHKELC